MTDTPYDGLLSSFFLFPKPSPRPRPNAAATTNTSMITPRRYRRGMPHFLGAFSDGSSDTLRETGWPFSSNSSG